MDSFELGTPETGSRLLSGSPVFSAFPGSSSSHSTGPGGDDLSLSELSISNRPNEPKPFSLLARPIDTGDHAVETEDAQDGDEQKFDRTVTEDDEKERATAAKTREERLQNDLFVLRKLNGVFRVYNEALKETESGTERVTTQLEQTNALLDKYVNILAKSELVTRLIFDERWQGAEADEEQIEIEVREAEEKRQKEEEERAMAAQLERERREREASERQAREEKERLEREKKERVASKSTSGVRGVRGTRASMRASGARGGRAAPTTSSTSHMRSTSGNNSGAAAASGISRIARPASSASTRGSLSLRAAPRGRP